jgi:hypothetical protein
MKKLFLSLALMALALSVNAQSKSVASLYEKYKGDDDFFHMELGGNFMNFADGFKIDLNKDDMAAVAKSIQKLNFFTLSDNANSSGVEFKSLQKGLERERYELLMEAAEGKGGILVYSKGGNTISDLIVLVGGDEGDLMVVEMKGTFSQEAIAKATNYSSKGSKGAK